MLFIASLVDAPTATATYDGHDLTSQVKARVEALLTALAFGTSGRYELEQRVGGDPSDNTKADYASRIDTAEAALIAPAGGNVAALQKQLDAAPRVTADAAARAAIEKLGDTDRRAHRADGHHAHRARPAGAGAERDRASPPGCAAEQQSGQLVQLYIAPPATYSETDQGARTGPGTATSPTASGSGLINALDNWVRRAVYPTPAGLGERASARASTRRLARPVAGGRVNEQSADPADRPGRQPVAGSSRSAGR